LRVSVSKVDMRVKMANSIAKTAELKTMAVTKADAICAVVALTPDLQTSESFRKTTREEKTHTWYIIKVRTPLTQSYDQDDLKLQ
jgi:hypothetical protein